MEQQRPQFDVLNAAEDVIKGAQLVEHPVVLPPFVVHDLFAIVEDEHNRRVMEGTYEPFLENGPDIVHVLQEKLALALPTTTKGLDAALPLNTPEINLIRQLLAEQQSTQNIVKEIEYEQNIIVFENAVDESRKRLDSDEKRLLMKEDMAYRKYNVRMSESLRLQWVLAAFLEEERSYLSPKASSEFNKHLKLGEQILRSFKKGRKFDFDPQTGKPRLMQVFLTGQQIDYLEKNLQTLKGSAKMEVYDYLLDDLVNGLRYNYPTAPIVEEGQKSFLGKMIKKITRQNL